MSNKSLRFLICAVSLGGFAPLARPAEEKPQADARMRQILQRHPEADANKDGVLSRDEVEAFRLKLQGGKQAQALRAPAPTVADAKYGPHGNVLILASNPASWPWWWSTSTAGVRRGQAHHQRRAGRAGPKDGISMAAIHYRFVDGRDVIFLAPQHDGARAIQFLRSKAAE
jgi:hypothetical protein